MFSKIFKLLSQIVLPQIVAIGIDIQDRHIAAVAVRRRGNSVTTIASHVVELDETAIENGEVKKPDILFQSMQQLLSTLEVQTPIFRRLESKPIFVLSIPPHHIYTETATFPLVGDQDLAEALRLRVETSLPWPLEEAYVDWIKVPLKDKNKIGVFVAAAHKPVLDVYLQIFSRGGWSVAACEFHILSLATFIRGSQDSFLFALIDEDGIEFSVFHFGKIISHYLQRVARREDMGAMLKDKIRQFVTYTESSFNISIQKIFILDRANVESIIADIENDTKLSIALVAPPPQIDSRLFIAYGASEREYGAEDSSINLMPPESSGRYHESLLLKTLGFWRNILLLFVVTFIAGFTFASLFLSKQETALLKQKFSLQGSVDQRVQQVQSLLDEAKSFNVLASAVKEAASQRSHIKDKLAMIEREVVLSGLVLNSLDLRGSELVMILNGPTRKNILNFKEKLEKAGISVIIPPAQLAPEKNLTVNATVKI